MGDMLIAGRVAEIEPPAEDDGVVVVPVTVAGPLVVAGTTVAMAEDEMPELLMRSLKTGIDRVLVIGIVETGMCLCVPGIGTLGEVRMTETIIKIMFKSTNVEIRQRQVL